MNPSRTLLLASLLLQSPSIAEVWPLDALSKEPITLHGTVKTATGAHAQSAMLNGASLIELKDSAQIASSTFTVSLWFNPYSLQQNQQMLIGKNRYSLGERQWGITIEPDGQLKAYLQQSGWTIIACTEPLNPGSWHFAALVVEPNQATLFLNGKAVGTVKLKHPIQPTQAPITLGGILDEGRARQTFLGALDEVRIQPRAMSAQEVAAAYKPVTTTHTLPKPKTADFPLWHTTQKLAEAKDLPILQDTTFHIIKKWDQKADGYTFLHGVGLCWHKDKLYASIGHNKGEENTVTEEAQYRVSEDDGKTWSELRVIDAGTEENLAISHGVFVSHNGKLWAFHGAYYNRMQRIHTRAYSLDETTGQWIKHGVVLENGFWALNPPVKMSDGNWIMPGISAGPYSNTGVFPAAVAISHGDDLTQWDFISIPVHEGLTMWGESSLIVDGPNVLNIARYGAKPLALISKSTDFGRTWTTMAESNLPMTTSKPAAGLLSNGRRYLVCTTAANNGGKRYPLTIAISEPGQTLLSKVFVIRHAQHTGPGESHPKASLSYPCATEHNGKLYVGFSNNAGRPGNLNSAELAVIPIEKLK